jgi:pilus assembly protein FimV
MRSAAIPLTLGGLLLVAAGSAQALGFGRVVNASTLGQPLNFAATVRLDDGETLVRDCVSAEVLSGETRVPTAAVRVTLEPGADAQERQVRITTMTQVDEPIVTVSVTIGCLPKLTRSFVTLIDPPLVNLAQAAPPVTLPPQREESQVAPVLAVAQGAAPVASAAAPTRAAREASAARPRSSRPAVTTASRPAPVDAAQAPAPRRPGAAPGRMAARPASTGPRLKLDPAAPVVATAASAVSRPPEAAVATAASAPDAAAAPVAVAAASAPVLTDAQERRITAMEESVAALRASTESGQKELLALQARLKDAEAARYANPLIYALAMLSALLAVGVAVLWWRQSHPRGAPQWWIAPAAGGAGVPRPEPLRRPPLGVPSGSAKLETEPAVMDDRAGRVIEDMPPPRLAPAAIVPPPPAPPVPKAEPPVLRRELSVEELIDLEQQADFFVVLGQDEAAIDLLMGHVRSTGGVSPLPYLKLLEIYRRRGEREAYERVRERFNRRFNAYAPDWDADLQQGKTLEDYPRVQMQLQRFWDEPSRVTTLLDDSLMRQGEGSDTFDLPAYRELLFLYSIARDLAEHPAATGGVDLLLPLPGSGAPEEEPIERLTASRLMGFAPTEQKLPSVDLDVTQPVDIEQKSDFLGLVNERLKDTGSRGRS